MDGVIDDANNPPPVSDDGNRGEAWFGGPERPELLITEYLAFHDRRTTINKSNTPNTWQQQYRPEGSLLSSCSNAAPPATYLDPQSGEFYSPPCGPQGQGIVLDRLDAATGTTPVWRLAIYAADYNFRQRLQHQPQPSLTPPANDPNDPDNPSAIPERSIYNSRTRRTARCRPNKDGHRHFPSVAANDPKNDVHSVMPPERPAAGTLCRDWSGTAELRKSARRRRMEAPRPSSPISAYLSQKVRSHEFAADHSRSDPQQ